ncbi:MAG: GNAT family N-acetyltransferase, partial [Prevotellaceae bacterium]|nr:GNAT family N-acetyltransferase [Prevotellaceae bacterium]
MLLHSENIILRAVEPSDLEQLYLWENDPQLWTAGNTRNPYSRYALKQYIADFQKDIYESKQLRL